MKSEFETGACLKAKHARQREKQVQNLKMQQADPDGGELGWSHFMSDLHCGGQLSVTLRVIKKSGGLSS